MFPGDEREIIHLAPAWPIVFAVYIWIWLSLTVTVIAVREQIRRRKLREDLDQQELREQSYGTHTDIQTIPSFGESSHNDVPYSRNRDH